MATRSCKEYQRKSESLLDATSKGTPNTKENHKASSCAAKFGKGSKRSLIKSNKCSTRMSRKSEKLEGERQLAMQVIELEFKEREHQLKMERLKLQKEMEKTKVLLEVIDESGEDESEEEEDKGSISLVLDEIHEDGPNDGVTRFLHTMPLLTSVAKKEHQYTMRDIVNSFRLPPIRVEQFKSDPLKYPMWISTFDNLIASRAKAAAEKLNLLSQHLEGEPLTLISGYLLMQDSVAYDKARKKMHYWYGGDAVISRAFLGKLENWPKINGKDSAGLKRLSYFLDEICAAKGSIHDLGILDYLQENYKIIAKLPLFIESKWRTIIMKYNNNEGHFPFFEVFAKCIAERAEEVNIPTFDCHANKTASYQYQRSSNKKSCSTIKPKSISCDLCQGDHESVVCEQFQQETLDHRINWVQNWGLCFGCLKSGHRFNFEDSPEMQ
ncbi:hypothetical protein BSL78_16155 [Apostichopus japonicus]|uniref:Uncharacterized protein n=1 Tax=Stichopus japonicus TaxID=307972 RepID=A0A2G8KG35_STIJA|nr:hypothetical protein BSL78_16155 [Apostichopus japonicus]